MDMSKILIGAMRFKDRQSAGELLRKAIDYGFNYIDTSPIYCLTSETENSESWIGAALAVRDYRERVMVSTKCGVSNGGLQLGDFEPAKGFGIRTVEQFRHVFRQSLTRLNLSAVDYYHLWICHTDEQFQEAFAPGGWYEGYLEHRGQAPHLGLTTHADAQTIIRFLETGHFETVTIPLNVTNTARMPVVEYCRKKNIAVIAMNPLAGGLLAGTERLKELAYRYLMSLENVRPLIGFTSVEEVEYAKWILDSTASFTQSADDIRAEVHRILESDEPKCTSCGYCQPCPQFIDIGASLAYYNLYKYLRVDDAKVKFTRVQWNPRFNLKNCTACGNCETRCPNSLPIRDIIQDAQRLLYD